MAAVITPTHLTVLDPPFLKHPSPTAEPTCPLPLLTSTLTWSAESNSIFLASASNGIMQFELATGSLQDVITTADHPDHYTSLITKDRGNTIIYARSKQVVVHSASSGRVTNTFETHKSSVTSLSLSNDSSLLATTSAHAIHVHNLTLASHTVLRGISAGDGTVTTCAFHPHSRTRLLVGLGTQLLVYDTTRPSGPTKIVPMDKDHQSPGAIVAITCSPFSKTLVAVACSGGMIGLVDLEKEKALFRTVVMPAPVTCLSFSAEGAALYAGTEHGKFLILDLRALDKPPKSVTVSNDGDQILGISVQKKPKAGEAQTTKVAATKPLVQRDINKVAPATRPSGAALGGGPTKKIVEEKTGSRARAALTSATSTTPRRLATTRSTSNPAPKGHSPFVKADVGIKRLGSSVLRSPTTARNEIRKRAFSPPKSPVALGDKKDDDNDDDDLSVRVENLLALPKAKERAAENDDGDDKRPVSAVSRAPSVLSRISARTQASDASKQRGLTRAGSTASRTRAPTDASHGESASAALSSHARSASLASLSAKAGKDARGAGTSSASPPRRRVSGSSAVSRATARTPSPELPDIEYDGGPVTPLPALLSKGKGKERSAHSSETAHVDAWEEGAEGKVADAAALPKDIGRRVGFADDSDSEAEDIPRAKTRQPDASANSDPDSDSDDEHARTAFGAATSAGPRGAAPELAMQVSPRRSFAGSRGPGAWAPVPSPLRNPGGGPGSPQARAAQDMLQALLRDALHDFRQETKSELVGLHLDLIRMGSSWRREMREAMGDFAEEMRELREENRRLREENERLRRGY